MKYVLVITFWEITLCPPPPPPQFFRIRYCPGTHIYISVARCIKLKTTKENKQTLLLMIENINIENNVIHIEDFSFIQFIRFYL